MINEICANIRFFIENSKKISFLVAKCPKSVPYIYRGTFFEAVFSNLKIEYWETSVKKFFTFAQDFITLKLESGRTLWYNSLCRIIAVCLHKS
jgi:hypothetical protein